MVVGDELVLIGRGYFILLGHWSSSVVADIVEHAL